MTMDDTGSALAGARSEPSPWHDGELALQRHVGVVERMDLVGRSNIRDHMIEQHRSFFHRLPFIVAGSVDPAGDCWATILAGRPGFLTTPDTLTLHVGAARADGDPADAGLEDGDAVGLLGIELDSRRRNRMNGTVHRRDGAGFDVHVAQSYGNCPQYIRQRHVVLARDPGATAIAPPRHLERLDPSGRAMIEEAETFFIASYVDRDDGRRQVDVSHRGGRPGFVHVAGDDILTVPDFAGNLFFNTLGNITLNPKCGLVFVSAAGDLLQLSGNGEVILDSPEIAAFQGAERLLRFTPRRIVLRPGAVTLTTRPLPDGVSPNAAMTGTWVEAQARLDAAGWASTWRRFRVAEIVGEAAAIRSLRLEPADGAGLVPHAAGQHLPIRVIPPGSAPLVRTYTLSSAPSDGTYRISVKREGLVSRHLHTLAVGDVIEARAPAGAFMIDARERRPAVLMAAGIGITPILAMLRHLVYEGLRTRSMRRTTLFYAAHSKAERAFDREIAALHREASGALRVVRALSDVSGADREDHEARRIDMDLLRATLGFEDYDFYLCGPGGFMQAIYDGLRGLDVADARIHAEAFGPAALRRFDRGIALGASPKQAAAGPVTVAFATSGSEATWSPASGSLLDLAEAQGLAPNYNCRAGYCGTCRTRVLAGAVAYATAPSAPVAADEALICCAVPAADQPDGPRLEL